MTRAEKVARAQELRADGLLLREIAAEMGSTMNTVHTWLADPDLSRQRARRERYAGTCTKCGARTTGARGYNAPTLCIRCSGAVVGKARRAWTREALIACIRDWADAHGEPPAIADWNSWQARKDHDDARAERYEREGWPSFTSVVDVFGSWNAGLVAAGFEPRAPHGGDGNQRRARRARAVA